MRRLFTLALLVCASVTAQAKLGETKAQIIQRFSQVAMTKSGANFMEFASKNYVYVTFDGTDRAVMELYMIRTVYRDADAMEIVKTVLGGMRLRWERVNAHSMRSADGMYEIADVEVEPGYRWGIAVMCALPHPVPAATPAPQPAPQVVAPGVDPSRTPADCAIVAAQAYAKLKPVTYWCQIVGMKAFWQDDGKSSGHAMVIYKYQGDGNVFAYDERGTRTLATTSENLEAIQPAPQSAMPDCGIEKLVFLTH
jgi:hypothetical protein